METTKLKAYGYTRISTSNQDLERQRMLISDCCKDRNFELIDVIEDDQISGANRDRAGLKNIHSLTNDDCDIVVVSELSRLYRDDDIMETLVYINNLIKKDIGVLFIDEPEKIYQIKLEILDIVKLAIGAVQAAKEREKIATRMSTGMDAKFLDTPNAYRGSILPIGFKAIDNPQYIPIGEPDFVKLYAKKIVVIDEDKRELINEIFNFVIGGKTLRDIAIILNDRGLRTVRNKLFTESTISSIIKNRMYNGFIRRRKKVYELGFEIIDTERFELANKRLKENQLFKNTGNVNFNPLKGIAKCPCGYSLMINQGNLKKNPKYFVMTCVGKKQLKHKGKCSNGGIDADIFFDSIWQTVSLRLGKTDYHLKSNERIQQINNEIERLRDNIITYNNNIDNKETDKQSIIIRLQTLTNEELIKASERSFESKTDEIKKLKAEIKLTKDKITELESTIDSIGNIYEAEFYKNVSEQEKQEIYKAQIETITYYSVTQFKGFIHILYKNDSENIIAIKKHRNPFVKLLPHHFYFNTENRTVQYSTNEMNFENGFELSGKVEYEIEFDELEKNNFGEYLDITSEQKKLRKQLKD